MFTRGEIKGFCLPISDLPLKDFSNLISLERITWYIDQRVWFSLWIGRGRSKRLLLPRLWQGSHLYPQISLRDQVYSNKLSQAPYRTPLNLKYDPLPCRYQLASVSLGSKIAFQGSSFSFLIHLLLILRSSSRESGTLFQRGVEAIDGVRYKGVDPWNQRHWPKMTEEKISWEVPLFL